jgi:hypothetical protein
MARGVSLLQLLLGLAATAVLTALVGYIVTPRDAEPQHISRAKEECDRAGYLPDHVERMLKRSDYPATRGQVDALIEGCKATQQRQLTCASKTGDLDWATRQVCAPFGTHPKAGVHPVLQQQLEAARPN